MRIRSIGLWTLSVLGIVGCDPEGSAEERTNYTTTYASISSYGGTQATTGSKLIPEALWVDAKEAKEWSERRKAEWDALGYEVKGTIHPGHAFSRWVKRYWNSHREFFGLLPNGQRGAEIEGMPKWLRSGSKMCVSNEEIVDRLIADWVKEGKPENLRCGEMDCLFGYCRCGNCRALDADRPGERFLATKTDRYVNFWNRVAAKARALRPDVKVSVHLYGRYYEPPRREKVLYPDNMVFSFVAKFQDPDPVATIRAWQRAGLKNFFFRPNYLCNRSCFPIGREKFIWRQHRDLLAVGSLGDCFDSTCGVPATDFDHYTAVRLCADPNCTFDEIECGWCSRFGAAAETVKAYYARIRERCDRGFAKLLAQLKAEDTEFLDDSHFSRHYFKFHTVADLEGDLRILESFDAAKLDGESKRRFEDLKINARHYIVARRAHETESAADLKALLDYRIAHKASLGMPWKAYWNKGEFWLWNKDPAKRRYEDTGIVRVVEEMENRLPPYWPEIRTVRDYGVGKGCAHKDVPKDLHFTREEEQAYHDRMLKDWTDFGYVSRAPYRSGHSFRPWTKTLWDSHREYFGMLPNGQRGLTYPGLPEWLPGLSKVCVANEDVIDRRISEWEREKCPELLIAGEDDGDMGYCRCAKCRALDVPVAGEPFSLNKSDRYVDFWNRLAAKARAKRPDVKVAVFLYSATRRPPRKAKVAYPDNMIFSYVPTLHDEDPAADIVGWKQAGARHFYNRPNFLCIRSALPSGLERYICETHHRLRDVGSLGDCYDRDAGQAAQQFPEFAAVMLCSDPDLTFPEIEKRFCARFGKAAETVKRYYANIRTRCDREWPNLRRYLRDNDIEFLDDSHFTRVVHRLHTIPELKADLAILEGFDASALKGDERERFENLKCLAKQSLLVMRMFVRNAPEDRAAVNEYRRIHKDALGYGWLRLYTKGEFWIWNETPEKIFYENSAIKRYADRLENSLADPHGSLGPEDPESLRIHAILKACRQP